MVKGWASLIALALAGCTAAPAREAAPVRPAPQRIVSLNPCTDAILAEVADPAQIAALSSYSSDPAGSSMDLALARRFPAVDGTMEEVIALRPDLVVGSTFISPAARSAYARLGLRYEGFGITPRVADSVAQIREIAALTGHPERGEALVRRIEATLAANAAPAGAAVPAVVWQSGGIVPGADTLISELLARTGFVNAAAAQGMHQADVLGLERMLAAPPRVIFAAGNPAANEDRMLAHPALGSLKQTRRVPISPALLWCGGPTIMRAAEHLGQVRRGL
jgi:iron complex transport system substrate-binding protein